MDTGEGNFVKAKSAAELLGIREKYKNAKGIFQVGEELEIKGSRFIIKDISPFGMKLKLLKADEDNPAICSNCGVPKGCQHLMNCHLTGVFR